MTARSIGARALVAGGLALGAAAIEAPIPAAAAGSSAAPASSAQSLDPFYASLLRDGELLADQGKSAAAAKSLRIACFGMLDQPAVLARCLVRLGLAQGASGDANGFRETFSRLLDLEGRTPSYDTAEVPPAVRVGFEQQVVQRIPAATLATSPTFQKLAANAHDSGKNAKHSRKEQAIAPPQPPPAAAAGATPAIQPAPAPPPAPRPSPAPVGQPTTVPSTPTQPPPSAGPSTVQHVPTAAPAPGPVSAPGALTAQDSATLAAARAKMQAAKVAEDLRAAGADAQRIADAHPSSVEANALAGEIFYRSSRWQTAALYLERSGPPAGQPLLGFYLAVAQFESGDRGGAAATLRPLLGKLQHTPYVQGYIQKILPP